MCNGKNSNADTWKIILIIIMVHSLLKMSWAFCFVCVKKSATENGVGKNLRMKKEWWKRKCSSHLNTLYQATTAIHHVVSFGGDCFCFCFFAGFFFFGLFFLVFFLSWKIERSWSEGKEMGGRGQLREDFLSMRLLSSIQSYPSLMIPAINKFFQCGEWSLLAGLRKVALVWHFFSLFSSLTILKITCWHAGTECIS